MHKANFQRYLHTTWKYKYMSTLYCDSLEDSTRVAIGKQNILYFEIELVWVLKV